MTKCSLDVIKKPWCVLKKKKNDKFLNNEKTVAVFYNMKPLLFQDLKLALKDMERKVTAKDVIIDRLENKLAKVDLVIFIIYLVYTFFMLLEVNCLSLIGECKFLFQPSSG